MSHGLLIVGGSYAGLQIAAAAREYGYSEPIRIVSDEAHLPYHRPPLSKGWLMGKVTLQSLLLRGENFYKNHNVEVLLSTRVDRIDRSERRVHLGSGATLDFDRLALATGARARLLPVPGADLDGVVTLRSLADAESLVARLPDIGNVVVIGGGFIGLEVASALATLGKQVTVVEAQERLLARAVAPPLSAYLDSTHRQHGVRLLYQMTVSEIGGDGKSVRSVLCSDGTRLPADLVLVGIGALPNIELAEACGLACANGIVVDSFAATSDPSVVAAGDCTLHPNAYTGGPVRLESVQNANDQAKTAASTLVGRMQPYDTVPWFWSDQYELKLQMVGWLSGADTTVMRGTAESGKFSLFHLKQGVIAAIDSINAPADHMLGRKLIAAKVRLSPAQAADRDFDLKSLL